MIEIVDINDSRISEFFNLRDKSLLPQNLMIAETLKVIKKALKSNFKVKKVLCSEESYAEIKEFLLNETQVYLATKKQLQEIVGYNLHHGVLGLVEVPDSPKLAELGNRILILNGLTSPENVGTMVRSALAFGFDSIIYDYKSASPYLRRCARVSMGNVFETVIYKSEYLPRTIKALQDLDYEVIATANEDGAMPIRSHRFKSKICVVIGSEGHGMEREVIEACDKKLYIPISNYVAHINAANAASIFLYEVATQLSEVE